MTATDQQRLGKTLWAIADQLRGAMNANDHFPDATKMVAGQLPVVVLAAPGNHQGILDGSKCR